MAASDLTDADLAGWVGAEMQEAGKAPTIFAAWRLIACCGGQPDIYLTGHTYSSIVDAPWRFSQPSEDVLEIWGWDAKPAVILRRSPSSTS